MIFGGRRNSGVCGGVRAHEHWPRWGFGRKRAEKRGILLRIGTNFDPAQGVCGGVRRSPHSRGVRGVRPVYMRVSDPAHPKNANFGVCGTSGPVFMRVRDPAHPISGGQIGVRAHEHWLREPTHYPLHAPYSLKRVSNTGVALRSHPLYLLS